ncbi:hypothetical protein V3C99_011343 [Haemonchus contortus]|uniref:Uncharacterized protein n=1 Tax=Haemonchus contortus TaxID=6289 RepID=A0A7I4Y689_HAECO
MLIGSAARIGNYNVRDFRFRDSCCEWVYGTTPPLEEAQQYAGNYPSYETTKLSCKVLFNWWAFPTATLCGS